MMYSFLISKCFKLWVDSKMKECIFVHGMPAKYFLQCRWAVKTWSAGNTFCGIDSDVDQPVTSSSVGLSLCSGLERWAQITHQVIALLLLRRWDGRPQTVHDVLRLAEVDLIQSVADLILHVLVHCVTTHIHTHSIFCFCLTGHFSRVEG